MNFQFEALTASSPRLKLPVLKLKVIHNLEAIGAVGVWVPLYLGYSMLKAEPISLLLLAWTTVPLYFKVAKTQTGMVFFAVWREPVILAHTRQGPWQICSLFSEPIICTWFIIRRKTFSAAIRSWDHRWILRQKERLWGWFRVRLFKALLA